MTELLPSTAGFLPLHAFWGAEFDRAQQIVASINSLAMESMGLRKAETKILHDLTLRDMLDAVSVVEAWNKMPSQSGVSRSVYMVPAERLTAAAYTLLHFFDRTASTEDDDHIPVQFTFRHWGDEITHFLLVGSRPTQEIDDDEEEAA